jgi:membrane protease YdiL (CAAX protease family)
MITHPGQQSYLEEKMKELLRDKVRPVALTVVAPGAGFLLVFVLEVLTDIEVSKSLQSVINLLVVAPIAFVLFPRQLGIPFGRIGTREFLRRVGFYRPDRAWRHVALGLILAACTLSGMLVASILTGKYTVNVSTVDFPHLVFSLNPALWEELFFRGVLMLLLLKLTRSLRQAVVIQLVLFGLMHIKGMDVWALVDATSVMVLATGYTYVAYKTRSLVAGIVFHYFHDAFLYLVQLPGGIYTGVAENVMFYGLLWLMVGIGCIIAKLAAENGRVRARSDLYRVESQGTPMMQMVSRELQP